MWSNVIASINAKANIESRDLIYVVLQLRSTASWTGAVVQGMHALTAMSTQVQIVFAELPLDL